MQIFLLRHGDALQQGYDDVSRKLSTHGEEQSGLAASFFEKMSVSVDVIFSSPHPPRKINGKYCES